MFYTIEIERAANSSARLLTPYKRTDGLCIELYYLLRGATFLEIKIRGEDDVEHLLTRKIMVRIIHDMLYPNVDVIQSFILSHALYFTKLIEA